MITGIGQEYLHNKAFKLAMKETKSDSYLFLLK